MNVFHRSGGCLTSFSCSFKYSPRISLFFTLFSSDTSLKLFSTSVCVRKITPKNLKGKTKSSQMWLKRQLNDPYVEKAKLENFRCRSAFKLIEIDDKHKLLTPGHVVIDCGAAPGSWSQVAVTRVNATGSDLKKPKGLVISIDLTRIEPLKGATVLDESDFTSQITQEQICNILSGKKADVVLSDMAPKSSGVRFMDHDQIVGLCFSVLKFSVGVLKEGGVVLCKLWQGNDQKKLEAVMEKMFNSTRVVKPQSSRSDSAEVFLLGQGFRGIKETK